MQTELNASVLADLQHEAERMHASFSDAYQVQVEAERALGGAASVRSGLVKRLDATRRALSEAKQKAISAAVADVDFEESAAQVAAIRNEAEISERALHYYHSHAYQDAVCQSLTSKLNALEAQHRSEVLRLEHIEAKIQLEISAVAGRNGGSLEIQMGSGTAGHRDLCNRIRRIADAARLELERAIAEGRALRDAYELKEQL